MPDDDGTGWPWESNDENNRQWSYQPDSRSNPRQNTLQRRNERSQPKQLQQRSTEAFVQEMLMAHNHYRAMHQAPPLVLDRELTRGAQQWAQEMANREELENNTDSNMEHIGESLAMKFNSGRIDFTGAEFTDSWYNGISDYDFVARRPMRGSSALAFTQLVWKSTKTVGFGRAVSRTGKVYVVGRYFPPGNFVDGFAQNVQQAMTHVERKPASKPTIQRSQATSNDTSASGGRFSEDLGPMIGAIQSTDTVVSTSRSTAYEKDRKIVTVEEKYVRTDGSTYTRQRMTTYLNERPNTGYN